MFFCLLQKCPTPNHVSPFGIISSGLQRCIINHKRRLKEKHVEFSCQHYVFRWTSCQIRKIAGCTCAGNAGNFFPPPRVSDPIPHQGTCVTHMPWCMPGSLTSGFLWSRWRGEYPGIPGACAIRNFTYLVRDPWSDNARYLDICRQLDDPQFGCTYSQVLLLHGSIFRNIY